MPLRDSEIKPIEKQREAKTGRHPDDKEERRGLRGARRGQEENRNLLQRDEVDKTTAAGRQGQRKPLASVRAPREGALGLTRALTSCDVTEIHTRCLSWQKCN